MTKKVTLTLIDLYPITRRKEYRVESITNSTEWSVNQILTENQVDDIIKYRGDVPTVKIEKRR